MKTPLIVFTYILQLLLSLALGRFCGQHGMVGLNLLFPGVILLTVGCALARHFVKKLYADQLQRLEDSFTVPEMDDEAEDVEAKWVGTPAEPFQLTQQAIEDAATWSIMNHLDLRRICVSKKTLDAFNEASFGKAKIVLAGTPATGEIHKQWTNSGTVNIFLDDSLADDDITIVLVGKRLPTLE